MPSGNSLVSFSTSSTTQAAVIVPVIGSSTQYYIFSLQYIGAVTTGSTNLAYSIIDMSLNNGLGDVIASETGIPLNSNLSEKMIAITGENKNIWLIIHQRDIAQFQAYNITSKGINNTPIISNVGTFSGNDCYGFGVLKASPDQKKIVCQCYQLISSYMGTELYDLDPATGLLSNCTVLDSTTSQYGAEFSPDNSKLYTQESLQFDSMIIWQYNLNMPTSSEIRNSKVEIARLSTNNGTDLKLGPDGKIYFYGSSDSSWSTGSSEYLDCISNPNMAGDSCGYIYHDVRLLARTRILYGLPNLFVTDEIIQPNNPTPPIFFVPTAFTPNGDGLNDKLYVIDSANKSYSDFSFSIFNRFGQRVFYTQDIHEGWNGRFNNVNQEMGTYFFEILCSVEGHKLVSKGDITLVR